MRWVLLLAWLATGACAPAPMPASQSRTAHPTFVSLNPCTDAILAEVADPDQVLALSHYSLEPASSSMDIGRARRFGSVSGSVEEVVALHPDVIVSGNYESPAAVAAYRRLGYRFEPLPIASSIAESKAQVMYLAGLAGHPERGRALNARIDAALAAARPQLSAHRPTALVWQSGGIVPGGDTLIAELLSRTGFVSHSARLGMKQADTMPLEQVLAVPPNVILAAGTPGDGEDRMLAHPALGTLRQTVRARLDPALLWCGGPTIIRTAAYLAQVRNKL